MSTRIISYWHKSIVSCLFISLSLMAIGQEEEYVVKAALFSKISKFAEWPVPKRETALDKYFTIAVLGENPFGKSIEKMYFRRRIKGKVVRVLYFKSIKEFKPCHIMFVSSHAKRQVQAAIQHAQKYHVMLLSDTGGWAKKGIHVNFYIDTNSTIKFEINVNSVRKAGLDIDPLLFDYAETVDR